MTDDPVPNHYASYNHTIEDYMICAVAKEKDKNNRLILGEALNDTTRHPEPWRVEF